MARVSSMSAFGRCRSFSRLADRCSKIPVIAFRQDLVPTRATKAIRGARYKTSWEPWLNLAVRSRASGKSIGNLATERRVFLCLAVGSKRRWAGTGRRRGAMPSRTPFSWRLLRGLKRSGTPTPSLDQLESADRTFPAGPRQSRFARSRNAWSPTIQRARYPADL